MRLAQMPREDAVPGHGVDDPGAALRHESDSEKKLTMAPMEIGILKKLTP